MILMRYVVIVVTDTDGTETGGTHMNAWLELQRKSKLVTNVKGIANETGPQRTGVGFCNRTVGNVSQQS